MDEKVPHHLRRVKEGQDCPYCEGKIVFCEGYKHWDSDHLSCNKCCSTFGIWEREEQLSQARLNGEIEEGYDDYQGGGYCYSDECNYVLNDDSWPTGCPNCGINCWDRK
jgi:hypothetical protein